ncbi:chromate resistance protein ChrB domain-containing protein [uncultured Roseobacter sp.]|uniref:chromate resistance protein ChrB domain-containing protein n=1 Tax=uncultured Roseobacter sp. TaxID=114847 RepID=UPI002636E25A|nr:chromate resistance protein ChrB domain-containing protein [uncultured Roseobacter sp.]
MARFRNISPDALMRMIGTPSAPVLIDVTLDEDFEKDPCVIPTARRYPHDRLEALVPELAGRHVITICQKGLKLSQGAAALLRTDGIRAEVLEGGNEGWKAAGLPRIPAAALPDPLRGSRWVTRHRPRVDRIACPWLIRRFVDPAARFLFVPPSEVEGVAVHYGAVSFDAPGARRTHQGGNCTFDEMLAGFGLKTQPLARMARVIRGADTNMHDLAPEAAGLMALSVGLARMYSDDAAQLEAGLSLYDALYRWARDGQSETTHALPEAS